MREPMKTTQADVDRINHLLQCNHPHATYVVVNGDPYVICDQNDQTVVWDHRAIRNHTMWKYWPKEKWEVFVAESLPVMLDDAGFSLDEIEQAQAIMEAL